VAGSVGAGVSPGIAKAVGGDAGSTGTTEVDPDLARAVFEMRRRHGLFRDSDGDTRYSVLLSLVHS
jgi:hypothetical protein